MSSLEFLYYSEDLGTVAIKNNEQPYEVKIFTDENTHIATIIITEDFLSVREIEMIVWNLVDEIFKGEDLVEDHVFRLEKSYEEVKRAIFENTSDEEGSILFELKIGNLSTTAVSCVPKKYYSGENL